jgi:hypothetical protein
MKPWPCGATGRRSCASPSSKSKPASSPQLYAKKNPRGPVIGYVQGTRGWMPSGTYRGLPASEFKARPHMLRDTCSLMARNQR